MPAPLNAPPRAASATPSGSWPEFGSAASGPPVWYPPLRATAEYLAALILAILTGPIVLASAALVRLTSRGPAFFKQTRLGRGGRTYTIFKLRSMYVDSERYSGPCWSTKGDRRITPVGRLLRRTHVDELPQLWNVLCGEMSLVGPRPERPEFLAKLERAVPRYRERLRVRPGVTGLAQVQLPPDSDLIDVRRKQAYDLYYIDAMSPWLDLRILLSTPLKIIGTPYPVLRWLFAMPEETEVQRLYRDSVPDLDLIDDTAEAVPEPQPA